MWTTTVLLALLTMLGGSAQADPALKFPNRYNSLLSSAMRTGERGRFFQCDYAARACMDGWGDSKAFVGVILAEDRETVLAHVACTWGFVGSAIWNCINYDTGEFAYNVPLTLRGNQRHYLQNDNVNP
jgi:hypothetical protein